MGHYRISVIRARFDTKRKTDPAGEVVFDVHPAGAGQAVVTLGNADAQIGGLTISDLPTQVEVAAGAGQTHLNLA